MKKENPITDRKSLADYLKQNDQATLDFLTRVSQAFGKPDVVAYVRHPEEGKKEVLTQ